MNIKKPANIDEYKEWLKKEHGVEISKRDQIYYDSVTSKIKVDFEESNFLIQLRNNLQEYNDEYLTESGYRLLLPEPKIELSKKSFKSFLLKTFRKNIKDNKQWPEPPEVTWLLPNNWYSSINDILRTLIEVKYLDGVEFLIKKLELLCKQYNLDHSFSMEAKEEGYYAGHFYVINQFEIPRIDWDTQKVNISVEFQITTQLQEVIRILLHKYYDEQKELISEDVIKWQWDYKSNEFAVNYLGHILHYIEGMIMEIRDKQGKKGD